MTKSDVIKLSNNVVSSSSKKSLDFFIDNPLVKMILSYENDDVGNKASFDNINNKIKNYHLELRWMTDEIRSDLNETSLLKYYDSNGNITDVDYLPYSVATQPVPSVLEDDAFSLNKAVSLIYPFWKILYTSNDRNTEMFTSAGIESDDNSYPKSWNGFFCDWPSFTWVKRSETSPLKSEKAFKKLINFDKVAYADFQTGGTVSSAVAVTTAVGSMLTSSNASAPPSGSVFLHSTTDATKLAKVTISSWSGSSGNYYANYSVIYGYGLQTFPLNVVMGPFAAGLNMICSNSVPVFSAGEKAASYNTAITYVSTNFLNMKKAFVSMFDSWHTSFHSSSLYTDIYNWVNNSNYQTYYSGLNSEVLNVNAIYN